MYYPKNKNKEDPPAYELLPVTNEIIAKVISYGEPDHTFLLAPVDTPEYKILMKIHFDYERSLFREWAAQLHIQLINTVDPTNPFFGDLSYFPAYVGAHHFFGWFKEDVLQVAKIVTENHAFSWRQIYDTIPQTTDYLIQRE